MFLKWLTAGAAFGFKAFCAVFVFCGCAIVFLGLAAVLGHIFGGDGDGDRD